VKKQQPNRRVLKSLEPYECKYTTEKQPALEKHDFNFGWKRFPSYFAFKNTFLMFSGIATKK